MATNTEIANLAISHLGIGKEIQSLDTDKGEEASACRRFYDTTRDDVLRAYNWSFATSFFSLNLIATNPTTEWIYSYRYPSTALKIVRILSGLRQDTHEARVPYKVAKDDTFKIIYTDETNAIAEVIERVEDPSFYTSDFIFAFSYRLAYNIAPRVTAGDPFKIKNEMLQLYNQALTTAFKNDLNEQKVDKKPESQLIRERD